MIERAYLDERFMQIEETSREIGILLLTRMCMRAMPVEICEFDNHKTPPSIIGHNVVMPSFRILASGYAASLHPLRFLDISRVVSGAGNNDNGLDTSTEIFLSCIRRIKDCIAGASYPSDHVFSDYHGSTVVDCVDSLKQSVYYGLEYDDEEFAEFVFRDLDKLSKNFNIDSLIVEPLWFGPPPEVFTKSWDELKRRLSPLNQDWRVWTRWYDSVLHGQPTPGGEELDIFRVTLNSEADWEKGPAHVNALIAAKEREIAARQPKSDSVDMIRIPEMRPAAIEPRIVDGKIALPIILEAGDSGPEIEVAAFRSVKNELRKLIAITKSNSVDPRFIEFAEVAVVEVPEGQPTHEQLFRMGHVARTLRGYSDTVNAEWPNLLASQYHAITLQFDISLRQFSTWREFVKNAALLEFSKEGRSAIVGLARELEHGLRTADSVNHVDQAIPDAMRRLSNAQLTNIADKLIEEGANLLVADLLQSISNVLNPIAQLAVEYGRGLGTGAKGELLDNAESDGRKVVRWSKRILVFLSGGTLLTLAANYPSWLGWIRPVIDFLKNASG